MIVCFVKTGKAYLPELYAYKEYLEKHNISVIICDNVYEAKNTNATLYYRFGGFLTGRIKKDIPEIHEYHTISTGKFPFLKNFLKSKFSSEPNGLCFLNIDVENKFFFKGNYPVIHRDMGAESLLLKIRELDNNKKFDIAYIGSISNRTGVIDVVIKLALRGYSIALLGNINEFDMKKIDDIKNITAFGVCNRNKVLEILSKTRYGLNYIPDIYPLNIQTSTKAIEYLVSGIPIISNKYNWMDKHSSKYNYKYVDLSMILNGGNLPMNSEYIIPIDKAKKLTWEFILNSNDFLMFLEKINNEKNK